MTDQPAPAAPQAQHDTDDRRTMAVIVYMLAALLTLAGCALAGLVALLVVGG